MFIMFNLAEFLTPEQYKDEVQKRKEYVALKEYLTLTREELIGCPACYLPPAPPPKSVVSDASTPKPVAADVAAPKAVVATAR
jgi:hypothetical protein